MAGLKTHAMNFGKCACRVALKLIAAAVAAKDPEGIGKYATSGVDFAEGLFDLWAQGKREDERRRELESFAQASREEIRQAAREAAAESAAGQKREIEEQLERFALRFQGCVRQTLRRPGDPSGKTVPASLRLQGPEDLLPFIPTGASGLKPGDRPIAGSSLELVELVGVGGFGEVWKARDALLSARPPVALKFCLDASAKASLKREAKLLNHVIAAGEHPGIVPLRRCHLEANPPCLEYDLVEGFELGALIREQSSVGGGLSPELARRLMTQLSEIVAFAHGLNPPLVHRDLKPSNVLVKPLADGKYSLHVTDFGIGAMARSNESTWDTGSSDGHTLTRSIRGTHSALYASPEQIRGAPPDPRDDVHALGVIWYQMLVGDVTAASPTGQRWMQRLSDRGVSYDELSALAECLECGRDDRLADAGVLHGRLLAKNHPAKPMNALVAEVMGTKRSRTSDHVRSPARIESDSLTTREGPESQLDAWRAAAVRGDLLDVRTTDSAQLPPSAGHRPPDAFDRALRQQRDSPWFALSMCGLGLALICMCFGIIGACPGGEGTSPESFQTKLVVAPAGEWSEWVEIPKREFDTEPEDRIEIENRAGERFIAGPRENFGWGPNQSVKQATIRFRAIGEHSVNVKVVVKWKLQ